MMRQGFTLLNQFLQLTPSTKLDLFIGGILICNFIGSLGKGFWFFDASKFFAMLCFFTLWYRDNLPKIGSKPLPENEILFFRP